MNRPSLQQLQQAVEEQLSGGQPADALSALAQRIEREPTQGRHWCDLARVLARQTRHQEALHCLQRGAELDPGSVACRSGLGHLLQELSRPEEAIHWHGEALALQPDSLLLHLNHLYVLPIIASSREQMDRYRSRLVAGTEALLANSALRMRPEHEAMAHTFRLAYHGRHERELLHAYARLRQRGVEQLFPDDGWRLPGAAGTHPRRRLGFVSAYFEPHHSNTRAFEGLIRGLDRERFEVILLPIGDGPTLRLHPPLAASCTQVLPLSEELPLAWRQIDSLQLDLLFYTDIGMHPFVHFLASRRLAPVQVCGWGMPQSSGYTSMDYYLSSLLAEPTHGQEHYSETLVQLPGLPCCYLRENLAGPDLKPDLGRDYFFLPDHNTGLFGCLQHLQKLHPDFDAILEAIARALPEAGFVLVESSEPGLTELFLERIRRSAPSLRERLHLLQRMSHPEYLALIRCLDLMLDPIHFGSGITMFETMACGTPTICMEGDLLRSRIVAAGYRQMGIDAAPIARTPAAYVELAVRLMREKPRRLALRRRIEARAWSLLLDDRSVVQGFEQFAEEAITRARSARH